MERYPWPRAMGISCDPGIKSMVVCADAVRRSWRSAPPVGRPRDQGPFSDKDIALLKTFADQAVIAIENVRLFTELQQRTRDLGQSLEEVGALSEVSRAVSSSLDLRRVLDTVASYAVNLSGRDAAGVFEYDAAREAYDVVASRNLDADFLGALQRTPIDLGRSMIRRAAQSGQAVQVPDVAAATAEGMQLRDMTLAGGFRALLAVPMGSEGDTRGLVLFRRAAGAFDERVVKLAADASPTSRGSRSRTCACSTRSRTRASSSRWPTGTSRSSSPTCPTSCARR